MKLWRKVVGKDRHETAWTLRLECGHEAFRAAAYLAQVGDRVSDVAECRVQQMGQRVHLRRLPGAGQHKAPASVFGQIARQ